MRKKVILPEFQHICGGMCLNMAKGIVISHAEVQYDGIERTLHLDLSPDNLIDYSEVQRRKRPQSPKWVEAQQEKAANAENYLVATSEEPLTGFGVGIIPYFNGGYLLGGKRQGQGMKVTAIQGYPDSFEEMLHPVAGALRELYEEVGFHLDSTLYVPSITGINSVDQLVDEQRVQQDLRKLFRKRERLYRKWGVIDRQEEGKLMYTLQESASPVLPLDTIRIHDWEQNVSVESKGFFYWDPTTSRVGVLYPLQIETQGIPFSSENKFGTEQVDSNSCLVAVPPSLLLTLHEPQRGHFSVYRTYSHSQELLSTVPGAFNKGIERRVREV